MPVDYSKYPPNWKTEIRPRIMKRANNTCEHEGCDFKHKESVWSGVIGGRREWYRDFFDIQRQFGKQIKKVRVILTIAHLDHDEGNPDVKDDRLRAYCQLHHLRYDAQEKRRRRNQSKVA